MISLLRAMLFLIETFFMLYMFVVLLRLLLQRAKADFYNPITQLVVKLTNYPITGLQRFLPTFWGIDMACLLFLLVLGLLKVSLVTLVLFQRLPEVSGLLLWGMGEVLLVLFNIYFFAIIIRVVMSWINPNQYSPVGAILTVITDPILHPIRQRMPILGGIDLSPLFLLIALQVLLITTAYPLIEWGKQLAFYI